MEARSEPFLAFEDNAVIAFVVDVAGENNCVYATISLGDGGGIYYASQMSRASH
jgi:hypothetical protein